ncbi:hypothetical protein QR680_016829 [Steinernema hermaphroditum]|uniref:Uncharacterized protein n=1 Tax=Steinernema hermaphroditum TaxID=289476 RepID=A0AA39HDD4_9BILA|nr:hypothetical protein QR680_016829 [Steinernema hermaphroditum]
MRLLLPPLLLVVLAIEATSAEGIFEIDRIRFEVNGFKPRGRYQIKFCIHNSLFCEKQLAGNIVGGRISYPFLFDNHDGSWNNFHLQVSLSAHNGPTAMFAELQNNVFWRHEWAEVRVEEPFYTLSFRHRFFCKEGFQGITCDYQKPKLPDLPPTVVPSEGSKAAPTQDYTAEKRIEVTTPPPERPPPLVPLHFQVSPAPGEELSPYMVGLVGAIGGLALAITILTIFVLLTREVEDEEELEKSERISVNTVFTDADQSGYSVMENMTSRTADIFKPPIMYDYAEIA